MTNELGVWTADDCALVLIDYQNEMFEVIRSETSADLVELHVRLLAKTAKAFDVPIVLSTVGVAAGFNGPTLPSLLAELDGVEPIDRSSMNAFEDQAFREAVKATGRKRLIIGGLHTEICLTFATVQALKDGYDVMYVTDAVGGRSQAAHRTGIERLAHAGRGSDDRTRGRRPSCSATGPGRFASRRSTSSTGTSARSRTTPTRSASPTPRRRRLQRTERSDVRQARRERSASSPAPAGAWDARPP